MKSQRLAGYLFWGTFALAAVAVCPAAYGDGHGSIVAWGLNTDGQCSVPPPNTEFVAVAAGGYHGLVLPESFPRGDLNCGGSVNFADINPFVALLTDPRH